MLDWQKAAKDSEDDFEDWQGGKHGKRIIDLPSLLPYVSAVIQTYGWLSKGKALENGGKPTSARVSDFIFDRKEDKTVSVNSANIDIANRTLETIKNLSYIPNEYTRNLNVIAKDGFCTVKEFGMAVSMVSFAMNQWEREEKKAEEKNNTNTLPSEWQGNIKERLTLNGLTVKFTKDIASNFGLTVLVKLQDANGNNFAWFASNCPDLDKGDVVNLTGTVKAHNEYQGAKETVLTRCKIS